MINIPATGGQWGNDQNLRNLGDGGKRLGDGGKKSNHFREVEKQSLIFG